MIGGCLLQCICTESLNLLQLHCTPHPFYPMPLQPWSLHALLHFSSLCSCGTEILGSMASCIPCITISKLGILGGLLYCFPHNVHWTMKPAFPVILSLSFLHTFIACTCFAPVAVRVLSQTDCLPLLFGGIFLLLDPFLSIFTAINWNCLFHSWFCI